MDQLTYSSQGTGLLPTSPMSPSIGNRTGPSTLDPITESNIQQNSYYGGRKGSVNVHS